MFKKGKKKQENKVAIDFNDLGDSKENSGEAENGESTNLREEVRNSLIHPFFSILILLTAISIQS